MRVIISRVSSTVGCVGGSHQPRLYVLCHFWAILAPILQPRLHTLLFMVHISVIIICDNCRDAAVVVEDSRVLNQQPEGVMFIRAFYLHLTS